MKAINETKALDVEIVDGEPVVTETWVLEYPDGGLDYLQRRHAVTNPHERAAIMNEHVDTVQAGPILGIVK